MIRLGYVRRHSSAQSRPQTNTSHDHQTNIKLETTVDIIAMTIDQTIRNPTATARDREDGSMSVSSAISSLYTLSMDLIPTAVSLEVPLVTPR